MIANILLLLITIRPIKIQLLLLFSKYFVYNARLKFFILLNLTKIKTFLIWIFLIIINKTNFLFSKAFYLFFIDYQCNCKEIIK